MSAPIIDANVTSYLNCSLGLLECYIYYSFNTGIDKEMT